MKLRSVWSFLPFACFGLAVLAYISTKAFVSSFTFDESFTYREYVHTGFMDILSFRNSYTNNHILNSLFMKYSEALFGSSELALRLPNLILFVVFLIFSFLLFKRTNRFLAFFIFVLLSTNNSLIDFFGLARGYGMSCGFMLMSLYFFIESFYDHKYKNILLFHLSSVLAVLSSFTLLPFYASLMLVYIVFVSTDSWFLSNKKVHFFSLMKKHVIPIVLATIVLYEPVRRVIRFNDLDFGGKGGFFVNTVSEVVNYSLHNISLSPTVLLFLKVVFVALVLLPLIHTIKMLMRGNTLFYENNKPLIVSSLLLFFLSLAFVFQHLLLGSDYPIARFCFFLLPLLVVHFGFVLALFIERGNKSVVLVFACTLAVWSSAMFVLRADLYSCSEWGYDMETKNMIQKLTENYNQTERSRSTKIQMRVNWLFDPTINFYRQTKNLTWLTPVDRSPITEYADYYYVFQEDLNKLNSSDYEVLFEFKKTRSFLLKRKK